MSYPSPGLTVTVPWFYWRGTFPNFTMARVDGTGTLAIEGITDFTWATAEEPDPYWILRTTSTAPPPPSDGNTWLGPATDARTMAERYQVDVDLWKPPNAANGTLGPGWESKAGVSVGTTGAFRIKYPDTYVRSTLTFTFNDPSLWYEIWPPGVLPPGVDEANPVRFTAKPMASAKGALQTVIDGGGP